MNENLDDKQKEYIKNFLTERLADIQQALDDNMLFYEDDLRYAFEELEIINSILECKHDFEPVALNTELENGDIELWDCICKKCGKHSILNIKEEK